MTDIAEVAEVQGDVITTLFMSGLPIDLEHRELHNALRFFPGYKHCVLNYKSKVPTAFIAFDSVEAATEGREKVEGIAFDEDNRPEVLTRIEWARNNSTGKSKGGPRKRPRTDNGMAVGGMVGYHAPQHHAPQHHVPAASYHNGGAPAAGGGGTTTLFVGNLGDQGEAAVRAVFSQQPGMRMFKFNEPRGHKGAVCFVDFETGLQAQTAMGMLQGTNGGIRIELAKSSMGTRRAPPQAAAAPQAAYGYHPAAVAAPYGYPQAQQMVYPPASPYM